MKFHIFIALATLGFSANSQTTLPDNFKIGDFVEVFSKDSLKIYFSCTGTVVDKQCASYYRIGKMDTTIVNFMGEFCDYDIHGNIFFKASMFKNNLEGKAHYYYKNGIIKEEGTYQNNIRKGKWVFYYPNGSIQKVYYYTEGDPLVLEAYTSSGKAIVTNGNGNFETDFSTYLQCDRFKASGQLLNGKKTGKWTFSNPNALVPVATEIYEEGQFTKGITNNHECTTNPKIELTNFYANENLNLLDNSIGCPGDYFSLPYYKGEDLHSSFYPELQEKLTKYDSAINDQWLVVGMKINKKNKLEEINVASSINDKKIESYVYNLISKMTHWKTAAVNSLKIEFDFFFSILVDNNQIILLTDYAYRNR
jgi:antitoxin component YwqK of YwqJK toxin-antitoxin module